MVPPHTGAIFQPGKSHTSYRIRDDERGYGYQRLFVKYFNDRNLTSVEVDDPYIKQQYQVNGIPESGRNY